MTALIVQSLGAATALTFCVLWALQYRSLVRVRRDLEEAKEFEHLWEQEKQRADSLSIRLQELGHKYIDETDDDGLADLIDGGLLQESGPGEVS